MAVKRWKSWDRAYYLKKKLCVLQLELATAAAAVAPASIAVAATAAIATTAADPATAVASSAATALTKAAAADPWSFNTNGNVRMPAAQKMMKHRCVKPVVDHVLHAGGMQAQAVVLHAVADHPSLAPARKVARINSLKMQAAYKYLCKQSSCLMEHNRNHENLH